MNSPTFRYPMPATDPRTGRGESAPRGTRYHTGVPFAALPHDIAADPRLSPTDLRVLAALFYFARADASCWPSDAALAARVHRHPGTVRRALRRLESLGYLRREFTRENPTGRTIHLTCKEPDWPRPVPAPPPVRRRVGGASAGARGGRAPALADGDVIVRRKQEEEPRGGCELSERSRPEPPQSPADPSIQPVVVSTPSSEALPPAPAPAPRPETVTVPVPTPLRAAPPSCGVISTARPSQAACVSPEPPLQAAQAALGPLPAPGTEASRPATAPVPAGTARLLRDPQAAPVVVLDASRATVSQPTGCDTLPLDLGAIGKPLAAGARQPLSSRATPPAAPGAPPLAHPRRPGLGLDLAELAKVVGETADPILAAELARRTAPPGPPEPPPRALPTAELFEMLPGRHDLIMIAARRLSEETGDYKATSLRTFERMAEAVATRSVPPSVLIDCWRQGLGPQAEHTGKVLVAAWKREASMRC